MNAKLLQFLYTEINMAHTDSFSFKPLILESTEITYNNQTRDKDYNQHSNRILVYFTKRLMIVNAAALNSRISIERDGNEGQPRATKCTKSHSRAQRPTSGHRLSFSHVYEPPCSSICQSGQISCWFTGLTHIFIRINRT